MLEKLECKACGAILELNENGKTARCMHCGSEYRVEDIINITNNISHTYNAETEEQKIERILKNANIFYETHHDNNKAMELYKDVTNRKPADYRGWWGVARVLSDDFKNTDCDGVLYSKIEENVYRAINVASSSNKTSLEPIWQKFISVKREQLQKLVDERKTVKANYDKAYTEILKLENQLNSEDERREKFNKLYDMFKGFVGKESVLGLLLKISIAGISFPIVLAILQAMGIYLPSIVSDIGMYCVKWAWVFVLIVFLSIGAFVASKYFKYNADAIYKNREPLVQRINAFKHEVTIHSRQLDVINSKLDKYKNSRYISFD